MPQAHDDFYVGYRQRTTPALRRSTRVITMALLAIAAVVVLALVTSQPRFAMSHFEYGVYGSYEGQLVEWPYPMLLTRDAAFLLTGEGKFGVAASVRGHDGDHVHLRGSLGERGPDRMLQVDLHTMRFSSGQPSARSSPIDLGSVVLTGEIVDTKCHLGVMNPGDGKVHRECAVRCISGGAPPGFLVRDAAGQRQLLLLVGSDGRALGREVLDYVAEPVAISGRLVRHGATLVLKAEPRDFRRE